MIILVALIAVLIFSIFSFSGEEVKNKDLNFGLTPALLVKDVVKKEEQPATTYKYLEGDCLLGLNKQGASFSDTKYNYGGIYFFQPLDYELESMNPLKLSKAESKVTVSILKYSSLEDLIKDIVSENKFESIEYLKIGGTYQFCSIKGSTKYLYYLFFVTDNAVSISYTANTTKFESDLYGYFVVKDSLSFYQ